MLQPKPASQRTRSSVRVDGKIFRQLRLEGGLTQEELAARIGYSDRLVRKLESGGPVHHRTLADFVSYFRDTLHLDVPCEHVLPSFAGSAKTHTPAQLGVLWIDQIIHQRNIELVEQLVHPNLKLQVQGESRHGHAALRNHLETLLAAFVPYQPFIEYLLSDASHACVYWQASAIHRAEFNGFKETGFPVQIAGNTLFVCSEGMIIELRDHWEVMNR